MWLREAIESGRYRKPLSDDEERALLTRLTEVEGLETLPAQGVPRPEAVLDRGPRRARADARRDDSARRRRRRARGRSRDGAPRTAERARARDRPPVRDDPAGVRGRAHDRGAERGFGGRHRGREVPPRRARKALDAGRRDQRDARGEPESPRGGQSGRRGTHARGSDRSLDAPRACTTRPSGSRS